MSIDYANLTLADLENMSDEDFSKIDPSQLPNDETPVTEEVAQEPEQVVEQEQEQVAEPIAEVTEPVVEQEAEQPNEAVANENASEAEQSQAATEPNEGGEATPVVLPEKSFFDKVTAEFNANGKSFKIDNPDDVVSLMQKGLNYNQKMAAMKPSMKIIKALQEQGIESVEDLGFLFDLKAKKPEAIARLIQDSGIDAYELNEEKAQGYQPSVPQVADEVVNFEMAAKALEHNPHFGTVVQNLGGYDESTKQEIFKNPHLLNLLTDHVQNGFYEKICSRLEQEQAVGRLNGMSFLQAYDTVGQMLFGQPQQEQQQQVQQQAVITQPVAQPVAVPVASKPKPSNNAARQAAAATNSTATQVQKYTFTPEELWNMSEEEFAKIDPKFL